MKLLDKKDIAARLGVSLRTVTRWLEFLPGYVPAMKGRPRWREDAIDQWVADGCPHTRPRNGYHPTPIITKE